MLLISVSLSSCEKEHLTKRGSGASFKVIGDDPYPFNGDTCRRSEPALMLTASSDRLSSPALTSKVEYLISRLPSHFQASLYSVSEGGPITTIDYRYTYRNVPVCEMQTVIRIVDGTPHVSGEPDMHPLAGQEMKSDPLLDGEKEWPKESILLEMVAKELKIKEEKIEILDSESCVALDPDRIVKVRNLQLDIAGQRFAALLDGERVRSLVDQTLHATGSARLYSENSVKSDLTTMQFEVVSADGRLAGPRFKTERTDGIARVTSKDLMYIFAPETPEYEEISVYAYAEKAAAWLTIPSHRYQLDCTPITIQLAPFTVDRETGKQSRDNAQYFEPKGNYPAKLIFAPGSGGDRGLSNLRTDYDVVAHELAHHVITRKLAVSEGEQKEIHEGLADYLVYASTGDTCLGESVRPACGLRPTAGNDQWKREMLGRYANGTALALTLWKIRSQPEFNPEIFDATVFLAIDGLRRQSRYNDLIRSLLTANQALNKGAGSCKILNIFVSSGFGEFTTGISCGDFGT